MPPLWMTVMAERPGSDVWLYRGLFLGLAFLLFFYRLLPLGPSVGTWAWLDAILPEDATGFLLRVTTGSADGTWPGADLLLCIVLAWAMRRPDFVPVALLAVVVLIEDALLMRPPGLWTLLVLLAVEFLRGRAELTRGVNFAVEWIIASALIFGLLLSYRIILAIAFVPQPPFGFALVQIIATVLCYPLVVAFTRFALDVQKPAMGEVDARGRRL
jgi:rod shape-determining protein MreD